MQIKRDYSQPFFGSRRRRRSSARFVLVYFALLGAFLFFVYTQFDRLQLAALGVMGQAPTSTPFASTLATEGALLFQRGDVAAAAALFEQAVAQQPANVDYLYELGKLYIELDRAEDAVALGDQAIAINPQDPRGYALKTRALTWIGDAAGAIPGWRGRAGAEQQLRAAVRRAGAGLHRDRALPAGR